MGKVADAVTLLAAPIVEKHGCELWDVEYVKEAGAWFLRVYIDHENGVSIGQCEAISRELDPILDEHESLFPDSYTFEVSSAGAERQLRRPSDFARFKGHLAEIRLYSPKNGQKTFLGNLADSNNDFVELDVSGERHRFDKSEIANVRLRIS